MLGYLRAEKLKNAVKSYKAMKYDNGQSVIMKYIAYSAEELARFLAYRELNFPFLVQILAVVRTEDELIIVEEYVENGSLRSLAGIINSSLVQSILRKVLRSVKFLHENSIYFAVLSVDTILITKDLTPKIHLTSTKRFPTPFSEFPPSYADDIYLFARLVCMLITGDEIDDFSQLDDDLRITADIRVFLGKTLIADISKIPSIEQLEESDKYIRSLLELDQQEFNTLEETDENTHETTLSYPYSVRDQLLHSIASYQFLQSQQSQQGHNSTGAQNDDPGVENVFLLKMNSSHTERFSFDDDELAFQQPNGVLEIKTAQTVEKYYNPGTNSSFDDDQDIEFYDVQMELRVNTLEDNIANKTACQDDDDADDFELPEVKQPESKKNISLKVGATKSAINELVIDDVDSNFDFDLERKLGSTIQKKQDCDSPHIVVTPIVAVFYSGSSKLKEFDDDIDDDYFDGLDDKNADLFTSVVVPTQRSQNYCYIDFFDDDQTESSMNFDDDQLLKKFEELQQTDGNYAKQLQSFKQLCDILYTRRCHYQLYYGDSTMDMIIKRSNLTTHIVQLINQMYRFQSDEQVHYFVRFITLLMQLSSQFVFLVLFYQNIFNVLTIQPVLSGIAELQLNQFYPNQYFDRMTGEQQALATHCNYLSTIVSFLIFESKDRAICRLQQYCFDLFSKQDGIEYLLNYILCCRSDKLVDDQIKIPIFGCELFYALLKKYCEFKVDLYHKLQYTQTAEHIIGCILMYLLYLDLSRDYFTTIRQLYFSLIIDILQSVYPANLGGILDQVASFVGSYSTSPQISDQILELILVISQIFDDGLQDLLFDKFGSWLQRICMGFGKQDQVASNKSLQNTLLILMNIVFSSDARRRLLCKEELVQALVTIIQGSPVLKQIALSLLLELLKIPIDIQSQALLEALTVICIESLASQLFVLLSAQLLNRWKTTNNPEVYKSIPQLQRADFEHISSSALVLFAYLIDRSPQLGYACFNRSFQTRCYYALAEENSTVLAALQIVFRCCRFLRPSFVQKFIEAIKQLHGSNNQQIKVWSHKTLFELQCILYVK